MLLRVVRPMKRPESSNKYFRQRIPSDLLDKVRGNTIALPIGEEIVTKSISPKAVDLKVSLRTSDPSTAKSRQGVVAAYLEGYWQSLRNGPTALTHKQCVALSGELYRIFVDAMEDDPGPPDLWNKVLSDNKAAQGGEFGEARLMIPGPAKRLAGIETRFGGLVDVLLAKRGLIIGQESRERLLVQTAKAMNEVAGDIKSFAEGDYSGSNNGQRFPAWEDNAAAWKQGTPNVTIASLLEGWWREAKLSGRSESTRDNYSRAIDYFTEFLGHDDASVVSKDDVIAFKDYRLHQINPRTGKPASPKTVKDGDLAALKSVFGWAVDNKKIAENPALGVTIKVGKKVRTRPNYFRAEERCAILVMAQSYVRQDKEGAKLARAKRWIPWICAYTGARVGEIAQLRKQDVRQEEGHWIIHITPEAGTVKNKEAREVPVHPHLVETGFLDMVDSAEDGYLFVKVETGKSPTGKVRALKNDLAEFVRKAVPDPEIAPNHGWRHTFKTLARETDGIDPKVVDDITGHASRSVGDRYGASTIKARVMMMAKFPRLV